MLSNLMFTVQFGLHNPFIILFIYDSITKYILQNWLLACGLFKYFNIMAKLRNVLNNHQHRRKNLKQCIIDLIYFTQHANKHNFTLVFVNLLKTHQQ